MYINKHKKGFLVFFRILLICYVLVLTYFLFFCERFGRSAVYHAVYQYNMIPFREIRRYILYRESIGFWRCFLNLYGNILIFVPLGFVSPILVRKLRGFWKMTGCCFGLSIIVETIQFFTKTGSFDVDDIILNTLGGALGFLLYYVIQHHRDVEADRYREEIKRMKDNNGK